MLNLLWLELPPPPPLGRKDPAVAAYLMYLGGQMNHAVADHATAAYVLLGRATEKPPEDGVVRLTTRVQYAMMAHQTFERCPFPVKGWLAQVRDTLETAIQARIQEERDQKDDKRKNHTPAHGGPRTVRQHHGLSGDRG